MIHFVGAGPGNVDLITVKGRDLLSTTDVIIYAGSLVSDEHLKFAKLDCEFYNSATMNLDEVLEVMDRANGEGKDVVRLHTGDPSIYGAIQEQMDALEKLNIEYEVVPGVSSFVAAASSIKMEFTLPDVSQTVILTRLKGRTDVPESEDLERLASMKASMAIFLSVKSIDGVVAKLKAGYGRGDVPVAIVYKATWEDEKIIRGTLDDIAEKVKAENIIKTAQILVGDFLDSEYSLSKLYDKGFTHEYRIGTDDK